MNCSKSLTATQLNPKTPDLQKKNPERHWKLRSGGKIPNLAPLAKSFWKYQKGNETHRTVQCDVITLSENTIHNNTIKQYTEIAAISPHYLMVP